MFPKNIREAVNYQLDLRKGILQKAPHHVIRHLSDLCSIFQDNKAYREMLAVEDCIVYEMYETDSPSQKGELQFSIDTVYPGQVGAEYYMTKGHGHIPTDCVEIYVGIRGTGLILMERSDGSFQVEELVEERMAYVPAGCLHRTVNTGKEPLIFLTISPAQANTVYDLIPPGGLRYLVVQGPNGPEVILNPKRSL